MKRGARVIGGCLVVAGVVVAVAVDMFPGVLLILGGLGIAVFT